MSSTVEKIKEKLDVVEVIGSYIKLEKAGSNFKAKCPFHGEKTPSFFVSPSRGSYYCFGCGAKGDIFTFVQEFEGLDFIGSLKILADRAGVTLEKESPKDRGEKDRLYKALEEAQNFFVENLSSFQEGKKYLLDRGLLQDSIDTWKIGWAPDEWRLLHNHLLQKGYGEQELLLAGLVKTPPEGGKTPYDVFRGRIIFPIFDTLGRVIGFSGRSLVESKGSPKYLNSPETPLFRKSEVLYGLHNAKGSIRTKDYSILVEGQMDLLMCHQAGFENSVATSGTAFTREHLNRLQKISNRIVLAYDSDKAGFMAANKSAVLGLTLGMEVKIAELPKGTDPAELIKNNVEDWKKSLKESKHIIDFYLDHMLLEVKDGRNQGKEVRVKVLPYIAMLGSSIEKAHFISQVSKKTGIREESLWDDLKKTRPIDIGQEIANEAPKEDREVRKRKNHVERKLAGIYLWQKSISEPTVSPDEIFSTLTSIAGGEETKRFLTSFDAEKDELIFEAEAYYENEEKLRKELGELFLYFEGDLLREMFAETMRKLRTAEEKKDEKKVQELLEECQKLSVKISELSKKEFMNTV